MHFRVKLILCVVESINISYKCSVYEDKHTLWIVMEQCEGGELFDRNRARGT